jgi:hypothetical protein
MNVAITDPLQQRGLLAFDDTQLVLAGATAAAVLSGSVNIDGPSTAGNRAQPVDAVLLAALEEGLLYVVAVSRSCSGEDFSQAVSDRLAVCVGQTAWSMCQASILHNGGDTSLFVHDVAQDLLQLFCGKTAWQASIAARSPTAPSRLGPAVCCVP